MSIQLVDENAEIEPVPVGDARPIDALVDRLSNILKSFNDQFGGIEWTDADRVQRLIIEQIPRQVGADSAYQNARKNSDKQNARIEHDKALGRVMTGILKDDTQLFRQFSDNESFKKWLADMVFGLTYEAQVAEPVQTLPLFEDERAPFEVVPESQRRPWDNCVPLLSLRAAAGYVGDERLVEPEGWVRPNGRTSPGPGLFVAQVVGESMNRRIPNGAYCLFRFPVGAGSRNGRVVLVEHRDITDPDLEGPFTLKIWNSSKARADDGTWTHEQIELRPDSTAPGYEPIWLRNGTGGEAQAVAEFVELLPGPN
jgi:hypothetical protein